MLGRLTCIGVASILGGLPSCSSKPIDDERENGARYGEFSSELPGKLELAGLSTPEAQQLCDEMRSYFLGTWETAMRYGCQVSAVFTASDGEPASDSEARASCQTTYDDCTAIPRPATTGCPDFSECHATVSQLVDCTNANASAEIDLANALPSCSALTLADLASLPSYESPAACAAFDVSCPRL